MSTKARSMSPHGRRTANVSHSSRGAGLGGKRAGVYGQADQKRCDHTLGAGLRSGPHGPRWIASWCCHGFHFASLCCGRVAPDYCFGLFKHGSDFAPKMSRSFSNAACRNGRGQKSLRPKRREDKNVESGLTVTGFRHLQLRPQAEGDWRPLTAAETRANPSPGPWPSIRCARPAGPTDEWPARWWPS